MHQSSPLLRICCVFIELLERKKADLLTSDEVVELEAIGELDRIFTHINAMLV